MTWIDLNLMNDQQDEIETILRTGAMSVMDLKQIVYSRVSEWQASDEYKAIIKGEKYYKNEPDILERERKAVGESGALEPVQNLANNKLVNGFTRKLVDQKVGYLLSKPMSVQTKNNKYQEILTGIFDKKFMRQIQTLGKNAINGGLGWLHPYYDESGNLSFMVIPTIQCVPFWKDIAHTELAAMIRFYQVEVYEGTKQTEYTKYEWWDENGVRTFVDGGNGIVPDVESGEYRPHVIATNGEGTQRGYNWEKVPFIAFKYNDDELPLITQIKSLVDDYDRNKSDNSNNLEDLPNSIYKVKNYGDVNGADFRKNIALYRVVFYDKDGDVDTVNIEINTEAYKTHQEQNRKDIYEFGRGVDTQADNFGNASGVALKFLYADLDMDCNIIETEFQAALEQLLWFINTDLKNRGEGDFFNEEVTFIFNRDIIINETEAVKNAKDSVGVISKKTIIANHPWVTNTKEELERIEEEAREEFKRTDPYNNLSQEKTPNGEPS
ncbi:portal protein [Paenibacillus macerans]|uniref:phage portal protein n=1 Tax=Paenibacillus macerans TaxID=44252 RepID=UPI001B252B1B|nr:phage portal protein [Paenibacillus macerans]GIP10409.1 portal protein [Paenibacillus macerans]